MRILFFMPLAESSSGAEVALFNLIGYAAGRGWDVGVACRAPGDLLAQLPAGVPTFVHQTAGPARRLYAGVARRLLNEQDGFPALAHSRFRPDAWYVNTITQPWLVEQARRRGVACVLHAHELEPALARLSAAQTAALVEYPRLVFACSEAARDVYSALGREGAMEVSYPTLDPARINWDEGRSRRIRRDLGVGDQTFVWAMAGGLDPNKNPALFVEIARDVLAAGLDAHFLWVGGVEESGYSLYAKGRARALGVEGRVSFVGNRTADYYDHLNAADGVVVTSTRESFSVVTAEAAYLGKPVVSFDCGGVREIVRPRMGAVVASRNPADIVREMAAVMRSELPFDPRVSRERVTEFYVEAQGARWEQSLRAHLSA